MKVAFHRVLEYPFSSILDYGCGDGYLLNELFQSNLEKKLVGFEPVMELSLDKSIRIYSDLDLILTSKEKFDLISCFEVLEHFGPVDQTEILNNFNQLLNQNGKIVISVPIEIGFPAVLKNFRRVNWKKADLNWIKNVCKSFFGLEIRSIRDKRGYLPTHMGFSHKRLEQLFKKNFKVERKTNSPFSVLPYFLNSQVFYTLSKKNNA